MDFFTARPDRTQSNPHNRDPPLSLFLSVSSTHDFFCASIRTALSLLRRYFTSSPGVSPYPAESARVEQRRVEVRQVAFHFGHGTSSGELGYLRFRLETKNVTSRSLSPAIIVAPYTRKREGERESISNSPSSCVFTCDFSRVSFLLYERC